MKIIKSFYYLFSVLIVINISACGKTLLETPYSTYSTENLYKTQADAEAAIAGVYSDLNSYDFFVKPYWEELDDDQDHIAGQAFALSTDGAGNFASDYKTSSNYGGPYVMIGRCNSILERVPAIQMDTLIKNRILGEAHFLRSWAYFNLVRMFGGVPLRTSTVKSADSTNIPRSSVAEVYQQIISDLNFAETNLPYASEPGAPALGHVNKAAAQGFLAKVYVTIGAASLKGAQLTVQGGNDNAMYTYNKDLVAGFESFDSKKYYQMALDEANKLINSNQYSLFPHYMNLWNKANDNKVEHIWMLQTLSSPATQGLTVSSYFTEGSIGGKSYLYLDDNFYHSFTRKMDERILYGVTHNGGSAGSYFYYPLEDSTYYKNGPNGVASFINTGYITKYFSPDNTYLKGTNYPLLRYADVLLMYAEAENEVNGPTQNAINALNKVRARANPDILSTDSYFNLSSLNQQQLRSKIFAERGFELYMESNRRFDLTRWGVYLQVMNQIGTSKQNVTKTRLPRCLLFPLPVNEITADPMVSQNPGW